MDIPSPAIAQSSNWNDLCVVFSDDYVYNSTDDTWLTDCRTLYTRPLPASSAVAGLYVATPMYRVWGHSTDSNIATELHLRIGHH